MIVDRQHFNLSALESKLSMFVDQMKEFIAETDKGGYYFRR
jgi:hypothetical protein